MVSCSHGSPVSLVADAAPQVDDLLAAVIGAAGAAQLTASSEVLGKRLAHCLKARADVPLNNEAVWACHGQTASCHACNLKCRYRLTAHFCAFTFAPPLRLSQVHPVRAIRPDVPFQGLRD